MKKYTPVISVILAGSLWGIISLFVRNLSAAGLSALQISFVRLAVAAPVFAVIMGIFKRESFRISLRDLWMFIGTGIVSIVLFNVTYFYTAIHSQVSVAVVLLYTSPVFIMLMSRVLFREPMTKVKIAALIMTVSGCVCVAGLSGGEGITPLTVATGLASGLFYGLYTIFGRYALKKYGAATVTLYTFIMGFLGSLPMSSPAKTAKLVGGSAGTLAAALGIGLICTVLPYVLYTWGLSKMESGKAAILVAVEPLVGAVIGMTLFNESRGPIKMIGICLILGAIIILDLPEKKKTPES